MNSFIIPNWHPFLVHFTIALVVTSSVFFILTRLLPKQADTFAIVAKWTLWSAALTTVLTLFAGFAAFNSVAHDDAAHIVMKTHRLWALFAAAALFALAIWSYRTKGAPLLLVVSSLIVAGLVGTTGYLGTELVYRHGLGVMRLPDSTGEGHNHSGNTTRPQPQQNMNGTGQTIMARPTRRTITGTITRPVNMTTAKTSAIPNMLAVTGRL